MFACRTQARLVLQLLHRGPFGRRRTLPQARVFPDVAIMGDIPPPRSLSYRPTSSLVAHLQRKWRAKRTHIATTGTHSAQVDRGHRVTPLATSQRRGHKDSSTSVEVASLRRSPDNQYRDGA